MAIETRRERDVQVIKNKLQIELKLNIKPIQIDAVLKSMEEIGEQHYQNYLNGTKDYLPEHIVRALPEIYGSAAYNAEVVVEYLKKYGNLTNNPVITSLKKKLEEEGTQKFIKKINKTMVYFAMEKHLAVEKLASDIRSKLGVSKEYAKRIVEIIEKTRSESEAEHPGRYPFDYPYHI